MKNHLLPSAIILLALLLVLCLHAFAAEDHLGPEAHTLLSSQTGYFFTAQESYAPSSPLAYAPGRTAAMGQRTAPDVLVNGMSIGPTTPRTMVEDQVYLSPIPVLKAFCPSIQLKYSNGSLTGSAPGLVFAANVGKAYFMVNDRYLYAPHGVVEQDGIVYVPAAPLAHALGCTLQGGGEGEDLVFKQVDAPVVEGCYDEESLYWLSRAIFSESGNQPMNGRIAVGTVILNRVANEAFPNTVKEVVFAPNQFSPVAIGTIYRDPDEDSVVAAKLCFDGAREAGESLYFNTTTMYSWADQSREFVCTIGGHNFYL